MLKSKRIISLPNIVDTKFLTCKMFYRYVNVLIIKKRTFTLN